ncbi:heparan-alpha-glucosaminide N-acetyltransferase domain-containing protein [Flexivirga oryzae]|uniref:Heparan-alpha-glucosaminide N-acetyltransferase catalytic domain-containing protein n=1 Tax=Flexivirga oryzae TaxID=1794944 RepID=A0A839MZY1_9MICO|nr:heparan-alpha-glucosaminide N-acetyltransferase domain-containing protein [Flexivirga oryzae]MBB2890149.1 hypothetical protein [Flexivirga oryzae]
MMTITPRPVRGTRWRAGPWSVGPSQRFVGLDVARAVALVGMMIAHILPKTVRGHVPLSQRMVTGNSAALFAVLAGASLALITGGRVPHTGRRRVEDSSAVLVRAVVIVIFGLALEQLHPAGIAVILPYYGVLFALAIPFLWLRPAQLFALGVAWMVVAPVVSQVVRLAHPTSTAGGFSGLGVGGIFLRLFLTGQYPAFTWIAYLFCGMAVGRLDLRRADRALALLCGGALAAGLAAVVSHLVTSLPGVHERLVATWDGTTVHSWAALQPELEVGLQGITPTHSWWWLAIDAPHSGSGPDLLQTTATALAVIGAALLATRVVPRLWQIVFGAGAMTLTLYSLHIVMVLPQTWPDHGPRRLLPEVAVVVIAGAVFALLRLKGPLETIVAVISRAAARAVGRLLKIRGDRRG